MEKQPEVISNTLKYEELFLMTSTNLFIDICLMGGGLYPVTDMVAYVF